MQNTSYLLLVLTLCCCSSTTPAVQGLSGGSNSSTSLGGSLGYVVGFSAASYGAASDGGLDRTTLKILLLGSGPDAASFQAVFQDYCRDPVLAVVLDGGEALITELIVENPEGTVDAGTFDWGIDGGTPLDVLYFHQNADAGNSSYIATSGSITLNQLTSSAVTGSFDVQLISSSNSSLEGTLSGNFNATACPREF